MAQTFTASRATTVSELSDPRLVDYRAVREKDLAIRREAFIAESEVVLRVLAKQSAYRIRSVFVSRQRLEKIVDVIEALDPAIPVYVGEAELVDQVVGFHIHRGILAVGERLPVPTPDALLRQLAARAGAVAGDPQRLVVLEALTNHDNVGGVFRNAAAFGADAVIIDRGTCDPLYRKAIRVSVGGALLVPFARTAPDEGLLDAVHRAGFETIALTPRVDARQLDQLGHSWPCARKIALVLGTEGAGLSDLVIDAAHARVRIDIAPGFDSLNVATTSGVALHRVRIAQTSAWP
jgi:tRNA G18 (ribose-2'-O)-methylase SpoU